MEQARKITLRLPARLLAKIERLANRSHQTPEGFIETFLAQMVGPAPAPNARGGGHGRVRTGTGEAADAGAGYL